MRPVVLIKVGTMYCDLQGLMWAWARGYLSGEARAVAQLYAGLEQWSVQERMQ